jgi:hypothetical protein
MTASSTPTRTRAAAGPLVVSRANPRYFEAPADGGGARVVYLTGAHVNNNFHDGMGPGAECPDEPDRFDFDAYLTWLTDHGHNFIRLWRWEQFKSQVGGGAVHACMSPQPWARTGPGEASDGKPKFDLTTFDDEHFDRLRERVEAAGERGIYVGVMLFEGFGLHLTPPPDNVEGHPFHAKNNVNGIGIGSIRDYMVLPLDAEVQALQEAYVRKVVDTVQDLPNVLYEVANEASGEDADEIKMPDGSSFPAVSGDTTAWQYWVVETVKRYEDEKGYAKHPVGMTMQFPVPDQTKVNDPLYASPADWISPGYDDPPDPNADFSAGPPVGRWVLDPPPADGRKVVLSDTDHYSPLKADPPWAWRSFLRGHNPLLYDLGIIGGVNPPDPSAGMPSYESLEPARLAIGDTRRLAERIGLVDMVPAGELTTTGFALANPGMEYVVLQPADDGGELSLQLPAGTYDVEWFSLETREWTDAEPLTVDAAATKSIAPATRGPGVVHLKRSGA